MTALILKRFLDDRWTIFEKQELLDMIEAGENTPEKERPAIHASEGTSTRWSLAPFECHELMRKPMLKLLPSRPKPVFSDKVQVCFNNVDDEK